MVTRSEKEPENTEDERVCHVLEQVYIHSMALIHFQIGHQCIVLQVPILRPNILPLFAQGMYRKILDHVAVNDLHSKVLIRVLTNLLLVKQFVM